MVTAIESKLAGCYLLQFNRMNDSRGWFTKTFHQPVFAQHNINFEIAEEYFSLSAKGVFRGLHFQVPPTGIAKLVSCHAGAVKDYVVDLRVGSPTFGQWDSFELRSDSASAVLMPQGFAHGFYCLEENTLIQCKSDGVFDPATDKAISYLGFSFAAEIINPILSDKDKQAPSFTEFQSPFVF